MDDFLLRSLLAGAGVALIAGPMGSFVVWRRMAYFGDALAHSALLGVALGLVLGVAPGLGVVAVATVVALLLVALQRQRRLATDTLLGIFAHSSLSLGLVVMAATGAGGLPLEAWLFGDLLAVSSEEVYWIWGVSLGALAVLAIIWRPLLAGTVHEELALVEGAPVVATRLVFMLLIALLIAIAMKVVGVLLIASMLIIPAATARRVARTPEQMAVLAALFGLCAVSLGIAGSWTWDSPAGPSVVVAASLLFLLTNLIAMLPLRK